MTGIETLNEQQQSAFVRICDFVINGARGDVLILSAFAGSGKTYLLNKVVEYITMTTGKNISLVAFTGRAASLLPNGRTCHSLLYRAELDSDGNLVRWVQKTAAEIRDEAGSAIFVDEGSMLPKSMHEQLVGIGLPILYSGDIAQLPSIDKDNPNFSVMTDLDSEVITLSENMRIDPDALGIFQITSHLRDNNSIPRKIGPGLKITTKGAVFKRDYHMEHQFDVVICGMNKTRKRLNSIIRGARGYDDQTPQIGEKVICLNNDIIGGTRINNGELFIVEVVFPGQHHSTYVIRGVNNGSRVTVSVPHYCWDEETIRYEDKNASTHFTPFAFGYTISCHKSQGGTFDSVLFVDEDVSFFLSQQKYRYTGVSRAAKKLTIAL